VAKRRTRGRRRRSCSNSFLWGDNDGRLESVEVEISYVGNDDVVLSHCCHALQYFDCGEVDKINRVRGASVEVPEVWMALNASANQNYQKDINQSERIDLSRVRSFAEIENQKERRSPSQQGPVNSLDGNLSPVLAVTLETCS